MESQRNHAQDAQPMHAGEPAVLPVYQSIVNAWLDLLDREPWMTDENGELVTMQRINAQLTRYEATLNEPDEPYRNAPSCVKQYRVERWSWKSFYDMNRTSLEFLGIDPEPECKQMGIWSTADPAVLRGQAMNALSPVQNPAANIFQVVPPVQPQPAATVHAPVQLQVPPPVPRQQRQLPAEGGVEWEWSDEAKYSFICENGLDAFLRLHTKKELEDMQLKALAQNAQDETASEAASAGENGGEGAAGAAEGSAR